jgi:hypothetical protein
MARFFQRSTILTLTLAFATLAIAQSTVSADANSREGCKNQWLFNGVWRVKIMDVQPHMNGSQQQGWEVTEVWRNGTSQEVSPGETQLKDQILELQNGVIKATDTTAGTLSQTVATNGFPPAGEFTYTQLFLAANLSVDPSNKPKAVDIVFNGAALATMKSKPQFSTSKYNFHFNLGCVATGAAANVEGGSNQLAAAPGCMNQWMSNGIWKMRVTAIGTYPAVLSKPQDQFGWTITQTWVNASGRGIVPRSSDDQGGKFAPSNVTDEYLATQGGKSASTANVAGGFSLQSKPGYDWAPGASFTFQQTFSWGGFDANDKPIRVLVTFDDKAQNKLPGVPHYRKPADFRIDLTCTRP